MPRTDNRPPAANNLEIARRRERVEELAASGLRSSYRIADALSAEGIQTTAKTVQRDIHAIEAAAAARYGESRFADKLWKVREAEQRSKDLRSRIAELEAEWQRSKSDKERSRTKETKTTEGGQAEPTKVEIEAATEGRLGEVAYLSEVRQIQAEVRKNDELIARLLGLEEPRQEGTGGTTIVTVVHGIDLQVVTGQKPGILHHERLSVNGNTN